ncbi:hypothetical protein CALVIDRAFT_598882 [Calocera viscosa TUFC12733]|uniref:SAP domain-containing protein n=1 Tax=Calocera viscosa (strain TUFC12733) TaxID=1330018 RepID=A0A167LLN5_CALVF|nr:hypothetical protein CALVIDRAFT_598882 [Calocera viscosa TUFC12733]
MFGGATTPVRQIIRVKSAGQLRPRARTLVSSVLLSRSATDWQSEPVSKLKEELKKRGLAASGNKNSLIKRLVQADHSRELASLSSSRDAAALVVPPVPPLPKTTPPTPPKARMVSTTARVHALVANVGRDKFSPRPFAFAVELPAAEPEPEEPGPNIPFLADNFASKASESASPPQIPSTASDTPKVLTVASASTHLSGGPVSNVFETADAHAQELGAAVKEAAEAAAQKIATGDTAGVWGSVKETVGWEKVFGSELEGKVKGAVKQGAQATQEAIQNLPDVKEYVGFPEVNEQNNKKERMRDMTPEESTGLWAFGGILAGGWLMGTIFAPTKSKKRPTEHKAEAKH